MDGRKHSCGTEHFQKGMHILLVSWDTRTITDFISRCGSVLMIGMRTLISSTKSSHSFSAMRPLFTPETFCDKSLPKTKDRRSAHDSFPIQYRVAWELSASSGSLIRTFLHYLITYPQLYCFQITLFERLASYVASLAF